jgi:GntR family transcriptional repressor for pyruvate dehydrogenase complex
MVGPKRQSIAQDVARRLRQVILRGEYRPGDKLPPERQLAEALGVNRATLREALKNLEQAGLVRIRQGDGTRVQDFLQTAGLDMLAHLLSLGEASAVSILKDIMEFRQVIGRELARLAARRATGQQLARLQAIAGRSSATPQEALIQDLDFYQELARASNNTVFVLLLNPLMETVRRFAALFVHLNPSAEEVRSHHHELLEAVRLRDAEAASLAADRHLHRGKEHLLGRLRREAVVLGQTGGADEEGSR